MSVEELRADIDRAIADLPNVNLFAVDDVKQYLASTLLPLLENVVNELDEHDEDIESLMETVDGTADMLQPETAGLFAMTIKVCLELRAELGKRLRPGNAGDEKWKKKLLQVDQVCKVAEAKLMEITVEPADDGDVEYEDAPAQPVNPSPDIAPASAGNDNAEQG